MAEIKKGPALLSYDDVRWLLKDHHVKRAGPLRWRTEKIHVAVPGSSYGRVETVKTLQELWQIGKEYEWRDIEEVNE